MIPDLDKPNRRTVEALFRDLLYRNALPNLGEESTRAYAAAREREEEVIQKDKECQRLDKIGKQKAAQLYQLRRKVEERARIVKRRYQTEGLTKAILQELKGLVAWINKIEKTGKE